MNDRENVLVILQQLADELKGRETAIISCFVFHKAITDAISLLKEQEAVSPFFVTGDGQFFCGACEFPLGVSGVNYCPGCGKRVKWT